MGLPARLDVNNAFYNELGERWYAAKDDPVALLRAENRLRNPWIARMLDQRLGHASHKILDVGCGAGFLTNFLAARGHQVTGIDVSDESLSVAEARDLTRQVRYLRGDALRLPFPNQSFDAVCAMDFLEHVETPERAIAEAARVLRPHGLFFFHTYARNTLSWLVAIKGVEWFVANTPERMHLLRLFIQPRELERMCGRYGLRVVNFRGVRPVLLSGAFVELLRHGNVRDDFRFEFTRFLGLGYCGFARRHKD